MPNGVPPDPAAAAANDLLPPDDQSVGVAIVKKELDPNGDVVELIFTKTDRYVLYESAGQIRYVLPKSVILASRYRASINTLAGLKASIDSSRTWFRPKRTAGLSFGLECEYIRSARETCWGLQQVFEAVDLGASERPVPPSVVDSSRSILVQVDERLRSLVKSRFRKKYIAANAASFALSATVLCLGCWNLPAAWPHHETVYDFCRFGAFGALGAFISVLAGINAIEPNLNVGSWESFFGGFTRILIGVVGAFIVVLALGAGLLDHVAHPAGEAASSNADSVMRMKYLLAFAGGFSESLLPNVLKTERTVFPTDGPVAARPPVADASASAGT